MTRPRPIRLFVDAHVFDQEFQGTRTFLREIYLLLARREDIQLFMAAYHPETLKKTFPSRPNVQFLRYKSHSSLIRLSIEIPLLLKKHAIDYAHFQYICPLVKASRYIVTLHDVIFREYPEEFSRGYRMMKKFLFKRSAGMADVITTVSEYSERSIRSFLGVPSTMPIHIVPNGVGEKFFEPYDRLRSKEYLSRKYGLEKPILYVSRIEPRKNHVSLLQAYLQLKLYDRGYHLVLLGSRSIATPDFDRLLQETSPEVRKYIFMDHRVDDDDLIEFYRAAEVMVYPSKAEGFGIPPLEAAALRIPVICSNSSAMEQFTFFGDNHIDPSDLPLLTARLAAILENPPLTGQLAALSDTVGRTYSWGRAEEVFYQAIVSFRTE